MLHYWASKLSQEEPSSLAKVEKEYINLNGEAAQKLHSDYLHFLANAQKHKKGTKIRLNEILRYTYYYSNYAHQCFIEGKKEKQAKEILKSFWKSHGEEILKHAEREDYRINWVLRLAKQSQDVGVNLKNQWISRLEAMVKPPDPILRMQSKNKLKMAEQNLNQEETTTALILADQSLELLLKDLCIRFGCESSTFNDKGKPFGKWGVTEYLSFLDKAGAINDYEKKLL